MYTSTYRPTNKKKTMKTEFEKMRSGELYDWSDPQIDESLRRSRLACERLNGTGMDHDGYREALEALIPGVPPSVTILPPFHCDHGHGLRLGEGVFINYNATLLDTAFITVGAHTMFGPNVSIYTCNHPLDWRLRRHTVETALPVTIGADCWLGGQCRGASGRDDRRPLRDRRRERGGARHPIGFAGSREPLSCNPQTGQP